MLQNIKHILFLSIKESVFFADTKKEHEKSRDTRKHLGQTRNIKLLLVNYYSANSESISR